MSYKTICDKCSKETTNSKGWANFFDFDRDKDLETSLDLCPECFELVEKFIEE